MAKPGTLLHTLGAALHRARTGRGRGESAYPDIRNQGPIDICRDHYERKNDPGKPLHESIDAIASRMKLVREPARHQHTPLGADVEIRDIDYFHGDVYRQEGSRFKTGDMDAAVVYLTVRGFWVSAVMKGHTANNLGEYYPAITAGLDYQTAHSFGFQVLPQVFENKPSQPLHNLSDYLFSELQLPAESIGAVTSRLDAIVAGEGMQTISPASMEQSLHKVLKIETKEGSSHILKIHTNEAKARIEQAANYHLSRSEQFADSIAGTQLEHPLSYGGLFITVQDSIHGQSGRNYNLTDYVELLARLHIKGIDVLQGNNVDVPHVAIAPFDLAFDKISYIGAQSHDLNVRGLRDMREQYEETRERLLSHDGVLLHGDPKEQNRLDGRWIDLEYMGLGDPAWDLAFLLNDPRQPMNDDRRRALVGHYHRTATRLMGTDYSDGKAEELFHRVKATMDVRRMNSIAHNLHRESGPIADQKIAYLAKQR